MSLSDRRQQYIHLLKLFMGQHRSAHDQKLKILDETSCVWKVEVCPLNPFLFALISRHM